MSITFVVEVADKPGVLNRVSSLVRRRGYNIESLTVGHAGTPGVSRITLVMEANPDAAARIEANLYKLVHVQRVINVSDLPTVYRHLALIKVAASAESRSQVMQLVDVFRARVVDVAPDSLIIEITGADEKIDGLLEILRPFGVLEVAKTGCLAMVRGASVRPASSATPGGSSADPVDAAVSFSV
ncbi:MAG TPA: acetolactate synthase small subunit [Vicinamibacterales bacterium]|jgi:acetolactate synthase-1/3 small subunit|nr:acetolactate synthase small subunit [Vicinamibacterales bacterium]